MPNREIIQYRDLDDLKQRTNGILHIEPEDRKVWVLNKERVQVEYVIDDLLYTALYSESAELREAIHPIILQIAAQMGNPSSTLNAVYEATAGTSDAEFAIPAISLPVLTYDAARVVFRVKSGNPKAPVIFSIPVPEQGIASRQLTEYTDCILAASVKEQQADDGWGPIYLQGILPAVNPEEYSDDPDETIKRYTDMIDSAISAGIYNFIVDASALVNYNKKTATARQRLNARVIAAILGHTRSVEPKKVQSTVHASLGNITRLNSHDDPRALIRRIEKEGNKKLSERLSLFVACPEISSESGEESAIDWAPLQEIAEYSRHKRGVAGIAWNCDTLLEEEVLKTLPSHGVVEYHTENRFDDFILNHNLLPESIRNSYTAVGSGYESEQVTRVSEDISFEEPYYRWLPRHLWGKTYKNRKQILEDLKRQVGSLFRSLGIKT